MFMRIIEKMTRKQMLAKLNNAYRVLLGGEIEQDSISADQLKEFGNLIQMDIVSFSSYGNHPENFNVDRDAMLILEGRRQMAHYMLKNLDITPREIIEKLNDSVTQQGEIIDD